MVRRSTLFVATVALAFLGAPAVAQDRVGVTAAVRGDVSVTSGGVSRAARSGESMFLGDRVSTALDARLQVLLLDESVFTIGAGNDLVIDRFVYDPDRETGEIAARATQGLFRFVSGRIPRTNPTDVQISTPAATIGVRGTIIEVALGADAIALAEAAGLIPPGSVTDPSGAVFVFLRGPSTSYGGIGERGRVLVTTPTGTVEVRREGFGTFIPAPGALPSSPVSIPPAVQTATSQRIDLPSVGGSATVGGVQLTEVPAGGSGVGIGRPGSNGQGGGIPGPGPGGDLPGLNPEVVGGGFVDEITPPDPPSDPVYDPGT